MSLDDALQPIDMATFEDAIYDWLVTVLELVEPGRVIIEDQNVPQPAYPYVSWKVIADEKEGGKDETRVSYDASRDGEEIELLTTGPVRLTVTLSFHVDEKNGANNPGANAYWMAARARSSLGMQRVIDNFNRAASSSQRARNIAIVRELGVQNTSVVVNGEWLSRATLDVHFRVATEMTERLGYIETVEMSSEQLGIDDTIP